MLKKGSFSSNFLVLFSGNTVSQIVPILFGPILGRIYTDETDFAMRGNFFALATIVSIAAAGRYENALVLPADKKKAMNLFGIAIRLTLIVSVLSLLFYVFRDEIDSFYQNGRLSEYIIFLVVAIPLFSLNNIFTQWLVREKNYKALTSSKIALSAFTSVFTILFGYAGYGVLGMILGTIVGLTISFIMMYISTHRSLDYSLVDKAGMKSAAKEYKDFPLINGPHAFVDILFSQFILYAIITREFGLEELGFFMVMSTYLLGSMKAIGGAVGQLYYKEASDRYSSGENVAFAFFRSIKLVLFFAIPVCLIIWFFGPELFGLYLGPNYVRSGEFAQIMIIPIFVSFIVSPVSATPIIYRKQGWAFLFSLIGYSISIIAILIGNYLQFDFYHTLMIFAASQTLYYIWLFVWYTQLIRQKR